MMCIVTGPRIDLAIALIDRMKKLFVAAASFAVALSSFFISLCTLLIIFFIARM
jgi:hypothetical protein